MHCWCCCILFLLFNFWLCAYASVRSMYTVEQDTCAYYFLSVRRSIRQRCLSNEQSDYANGRKGRRRRRRRRRTWRAKREKRRNSLQAYVKHGESMASAGEREKIAINMAHLEFRKKNEENKMITLICEVVRQKGWKKNRTCPFFTSPFTFNSTFADFLFDERWLSPYVTLQLETWINDKCSFS